MKLEKKKRTEKELKDLWKRIPCNDACLLGRSRCQFEKRCDFIYEKIKEVANIKEIE